VQRTGHVKLSVYNTLGQRVNTLVDENRSVGEYSVQWDGKNESGSSVASGVYFYQLEVGDFVSSKKMVILK
jgi:flagellar hook assembly protein FlgD